MFEKSLLFFKKPKIDNNMKVLEFRRLSIEDKYDSLYEDGFAWSRPYEYPLVIEWIKKRHQPGNVIHNSSWGFAGIHITFKEKLDDVFGNAFHSDILKSELPNTFVYDISKNPESAEKEKYDFVLNVSTLEEVKGDHTAIFDNLLRQVKVGGLLILTFDLNASRWSPFRKRRVLQLKRFQRFLGEKISEPEQPLNGENSITQNKKYSRLNCGILVIEK